MPLSDLCRENLVTIEPNATLLDAARLMKEKHVGDLLVVGREQHSSPELMGIITDRDILLATTDGCSLHDKRVAAVMSRNPQTVNGRDGIYKATNIMREKSVRRLPVVGDDGQILGIITADDLYQLLIGELGDLAAIADRQVAREGMPKDLEPVKNRNEQVRADLH